MHTPEICPKCNQEIDQSNQAALHSKCGCPAEGDPTPEEIDRVVEELRKKHIQDMNATKISRFDHVGKMAYEERGRKHHNGRRFDT